jgi:hypothetical protein
MVPTAAFGNGQENLGSMENTISEKHLERCFSENNWGWSITEPQLQHQQKKKFLLVCRVCLQTHYVCFSRPVPPKHLVHSFHAQSRPIPPGQ